MKTIYSITFALCVSVFLFSCSKKEKPAISDPLFGKWQWDYSLRDSGFDPLKPSSGAIVVLSLNTDSTYNLILNNSILSKGTFATIKESNGLIYLEFSSALVADKLSCSSYVFYELNNQYLTLSPPAVFNNEGAIISNSFKKLP